jgi:membrane-bound serine protease (ClpP class)
MNAKSLFSSRLFRIGYSLCFALLGLSLLSGADNPAEPPDSIDHTSFDNEDDNEDDNEEEVAEAPLKMSGSNRGVIITITDEISDVTTESIKRRVEDALDKGADTVIFEIDTPGGYVTSALDICNYIKNLTHVKTIAWVHDEAYSAGSMISVACDEIVMSPASSLGDCGVILGGPTGAEEVPEGLRAKAESPVLAQFRDSATRNDYDRLLCEAMVIKEREVYWIEHTKTGERKFVDASDKRKLVDDGGSKRKVLGLEVPSMGDSAPDWKLVESYHDPLAGSDTPIDQPIVGDNELLTMSQSEAEAFGFSKGIVADEAELRERYAITGELERIEFTTVEVLTRWLTSMSVRGFLMVIILLGAYVEFNTPGVGVPGLVALIALGVFLGAPYLTGVASVWEIILVIVGFLLIAVEIFVIPGFGVAGIGGLLCVIVGLLATFVPEMPDGDPIRLFQFAPTVEGVKNGVQTLGLAMGFSLVGMYLFSRYLPKLPYVNAIIPENPTPSDIMPEDPYHGLARVGDIGKTTTSLRPSGKARFGAILVDVVAEGVMIEQDAEVEVVERRGNRVVVRPMRTG